MIRPGINLKKKVNKSVRICAPSTSASVRKIILSYLDSSPLNWVLMPVPMAFIKALISSF